MKKTLLVICLIVLMLSLSLTACRKEPSLVGKWMPRDGGAAQDGFPDRFELFSGDKAVVDNMDGSWSVTGERMILSALWYGLVYDIALQDNTLTLSREGKTVEYTRSEDYSIFFSDKEPFKGLKVVFNGISPFCTVSVNTAGCNEEVQQNFEYSLSANKIDMDGVFEIDDEFTMYAFLQYESFLKTAYGQEPGFKLVPSQKNYVVKGVPRYITEVTSGTNLAKFKSEAADYLTSLGEWEEEDAEEKEDFFTLQDCYFGVLNSDGYDQFSKDRPFNAIYMLYSINSEAANRYNGLSYFLVIAENVVLYPDGKIGWGPEDPASLKFDHDKNKTGIEDLIAQRVTITEEYHNVTVVTDLLK